MESIYKSPVRILFITIIIIAFSIFSSEAAEKKDEKEKDCIYCKKYETLADWPESERPEAFIYEEINYPEKMFHKNDFFTQFFPNIKYVCPFRSEYFFTLYNLKTTEFLKTA